MIPSITVDRRSYEVLELLVGSGARGSVSWDDFARAMTRVGFKIKTGSGSRIKFKCEGLVGITLHRPHDGKLNHIDCKRVGSTLRQVYGWDTTSFEVA